MPSYHGTTHTAAAKGNNDLARFLEGMDAEFRRKLEALKSTSAAAPAPTVQERTVIMQGSDSGAERSNNKGMANGYCPLDGNRLVPEANLPVSLFTAAPVAVPEHNNSTGVAGTWAYDANYLYVCSATDTWVRVSWTAGAW